ncbi:hypothetical protein D3C80_1711460 [compost metagenome]
MPLRIIAERVFRRLFVADTCDSLVIPVHHHIFGTGFIGFAYDQAGKLSRFERCMNHQHLPGLYIHSHLNDQIGIFLQHQFKILHDCSSSISDYISVSLSNAPVVILTQNGHDGDYCSRRRTCSSPAEGPE